MAHWPVSVDTASSVKVSQVNRSIVVSGGFHSVLDLFAGGQPVVDEVPEGWDVYCPSCLSWGGIQGVWWVHAGGVWSDVGSAWSFAFVLTPAAIQNFWVWSGLSWQKFGTLPETFDAYGGDVAVVVGDDAVGWVTPGPCFVVAYFTQVVFAAGVDHEGGGVFDCCPHSDSSEVSHADNAHCLVSKRGVG